MLISLKKVIEVDSLKQNILKNKDFYLKEEVNSLVIDGRSVNLDDISVPIADDIKINIDENEIFGLLSREKWKQNYDTGLLLYRKLSVFNDYSGDFLDDSFWIYLTHTSLFKKYIIKRYFSSVNEDDEESMNIEKKIRRYYFGEGIITRTGLIFNWRLTSCLYYKDIGNRGDDLCRVAFATIDSVKAMYERSFRKNPLIVKAFVEGIINNNRSKAFTNSKYRTIIPTHISNIAAINCFDTYKYNELVKKITYEQRIIIEQYNQEIE